MLIPRNQTFTQSYAAKWAEMRLVSIHLLRRHSTASADNRAIELCCEVSGDAAQWTFKIFNSSMKFNSSIGSKMFKCSSPRNISVLLKKTFTQSYAANWAEMRLAKVQTEHKSHSAQRRFVSVAWCNAVETRQAPCKSLKGVFGYFLGL
jgi:hypothetical protein